MFNNYFYLYRAVTEIKNILVNGSILDIYSQEKDLFSLHIADANDEERLLHLSIKQQFQYLQLREGINKARKNVVSFLKDFLPMRITDIKIHSTDRIIKFSTDRGSLFYIIRGSQSNLIFMNQSSYFPLKKSKGNFEQELNDKYFVEHFILDMTSEINNMKELRNNYPMISSDIKNEILFRRELNDNDNLTEHFQGIVNEIISEKISVGFSPDLGKYKFIPSTFHSIKLQNFSEYNRYDDAIKDYLKNYYKTNHLELIKRELSSYFEKELGKLASKLNKLKIRIDAGSREDEYYKKASLLLSNIYNLNKNETEIALTDYESNQVINIKLDKKLNPQQNIDKYFEKARDEKVNYQKSVELFNITFKNYNDLLNKQKVFTAIDNLDELKSLHSKLIKNNKLKLNMESGHTFRHWHYKIKDKYDVFIGRDSKSNDYLSIKFAKQNDYWFHARGLPGSHVVLRVDNSKEVIPKEIIKKAAQLAAFYSKAKTAGTAPVSYTFAKFVYKKKGMPPGKVLLTKEKSLLVKPEIPKECVLVNE